MSNSVYEDFILQYWFVFLVDSSSYRYGAICILGAPAKEVVWTFDREQLFLDSVFFVLGRI
jgi:hypothetical protein